MFNRHRLLVASLLLTFASFAKAEINSCPGLTEIQRTPGEYSWTTSRDGWEGQFKSPLNGKGFSTKVLSFVEARWIAFSNLPTSTGFVQCDYLGNISEEVIRFSLMGDRTTQKPTNLNWVEQNAVTFPSVQATCSASPHDCSFWESL